MESRREPLCHGWIASISCNWHRECMFDMSVKRVGRGRCASGKIFWGGSVDSSQILLGYGWALSVISWFSGGIWAPGRTSSDCLAWLPVNLFTPTWRVFSEAWRKDHCPSQHIWLRSTHYMTWCLLRTGPKRSMLETTRGYHRRKEMSNLSELKLRFLMTLRFENVSYFLFYSIIFD